jgi:hypothetical protein
MNEPEKEIKIPKLKVITGGKENPPMGNWLLALGKGAGFFASCPNDPDNWLVATYHIEEKWQRAVRLSLISWDGVGNTETVSTRVVDSYAFCKKWECIEVLYDGYDEHNDRSDQPVRLVDTEVHKGGTEENKG